MSLAPGVRLGPYEMIAQLGVGGMGEVWRAVDTNLGRHVAIKVLPDAFAQDAERLFRFEREAKTLASLNHPNIAAVFGLEKADGARALVMELVEGPTLADRIGKGPIPVDEALLIAKQIAEALEAAHEQGIVHRDLKPANVKIREDGTVKVLDFGLAKAIEPTAGSYDISDSPTITSPAVTEAGVILGTAAYMSPEQARGKPVDKRSDVWALGCVLYEMLTSRRAFQGKDSADTIAAILRGEPDWTAVPKSVSPQIRKVLRRCLQKDRKLRLHDVGDVRLELDEPSALHPPLASFGFRARDVFWLLALTATGSVVALAPWGRVETEFPEIRSEISTPPTSRPWVFAISPDGRRLVFEARSGDQSMLWLRELNTTSARPLGGTENAAHAFWSPDGRSIGFVTAPTGVLGKLRRLDLVSGDTQDVTGVAAGGTWNSSDTILYGQGNGGLFRVPASGGEATPVTTLAPGMASHSRPEFLPDGRHFLYFCEGSPDVRGLYLGSLDSPDGKRLSDGDSVARFVPPDRLLVLRGDSLVTQRLNLSTGTLSADVVPLAGGMNIRPGRSLPVSVSANGLILYRPGEVIRRQLVWYDRTGKSLGTLGEADETLVNPVLSPDDQRVAVERLLQANFDIWVIDKLRRMTKFTFDPGNDRFALWSPDGSGIAFVRQGLGLGSGYYLKPSSNPAGTEELLLGPSGAGLTDWSRDGLFILFDSGTAKTQSDVWVLPLDGTRLSAGSGRGGERAEGRKPYPLVNTAHQERLARFSPSGDWVAYQSDETGRAEIYVRRFPDPGGYARVSFDGGAQPRWRHDGKELYFVSPDARLMAASIEVKGNEVVPGVPVALFQTRIYLGGAAQPQLGQYNVARDGRFLINTVVDETTPPIVVVQNWNANLRQ